MELKIFDNAYEAASNLSELLHSNIEQKPDINLGLATGRTMNAVYLKFVSLARQSQLDCSKLTGFALDEYIGLDPNSSFSYLNYLRLNLFEQLNFNQQKLFVPNVHFPDLDMASIEFEKLIKKFGGIDFQILGLGMNGHIGLNEPGSSIDSRTRVVGLSQSTMESNKSLISGTMPKTAITMGIGTILEAKEIVLIVTGETKAEIVQKLTHSDVNGQIPASALKLHKNTTLILDKDAAKLI